MAPAVLETSTPVWTFERYLTEAPEKAELIEGEVYEWAGVTEIHDRVQFTLRTALSVYCEWTGFGRTFGETFAMRINERNAPMPDVHVYAAWRKEQMHSQYADAPADLAVEIVSPSNRGADLNLYEEAGVKEYWVIDPERRTGTYCRLTEEGIFHGFRPDAEGWIRSQAVEGFSIPEAWLFDPPAISALLALQN